MFISAMMVLAPLLAQGGPVGPPIRLSGNAYFARRDIAYCPLNDRYVSVYSSRDASMWHDPDSEAIMGAVLDPALATPQREFWFDKLGRAGLSCSGPSISWNPSARRFLMVFQARKPSVRRDTAEVYGLVLDADAMPLGDEPIWISRTPLYNAGTGSGVTEPPHVSCDGQDWIVAWAHFPFDTDPSASRRVLSLRRVNGASTNTLPVLGPDRVKVADVDSDATLSPVQLLLASGDSTRSLLVWRDEDAIRGVPVGPDLAPLAPVARYEEGLEWAEDSGAAICALRSCPETGEYLLGWGDAGDAFIRGITRDGGATGPSIALQSGNGEVRTGTVTIAWNPVRRLYFVAWLQVGGAAGRNSLAACTVDDVSLAVIDPDLVVVDFPDNLPLDECRHLASAARSSDGHVMVQWPRTQGPNEWFLHLRGYEVDPNPYFPTLDVLSQHSRDGAIAIPTGGVTHQTAVTCSGLARSLQFSPLRLQVEVQPVGVTFTGTPGATGPFAEGLRSSLAIALDRGRSYHWQARVEDEQGRRSDWVSFGGNPESEADVSVRSNLLPRLIVSGQADDRGIAIATGTRVDTRLVRFRAGTIDDDGDDVRMEIEVRRVGEPFDGNPSAVSGWARSGADLEVPLEFPGGARRWRMRFTDIALETTDWISFGGNSEADADFELMAEGSVNTGAGCQSRAAASGSGFLMALGIALLFLKRPERAGSSDPSRENS